jgi:hypothetical protein
MRSEKGHRNRKNPGSAEFYQKQRKEQNAARPKQELVTTIVHGENGAPDVVKHTRVRE